MRVEGNINPDVIHIETYLPIEGYVEMRIRENVRTVTREDELTETERTMYEYDEYVFLLPEREDLQEEVEAHLDDWLITGRTLEVNEMASVVQDMKTALEILEVNE